jgi:arabinofuranan 3-O-arabinosyltransferase
VTKNGEFSGPPGWVQEGQEGQEPGFWSPCHLVTLSPCLLWAFLLAALVFGVHRSWHYFDVPERADGNDGHVSIDFGGQWLMGRLLIEGHARNLYDRGLQRQILRRVYPVADEAPGQKRSDAEEVMSCMMGSDSPRAAATVASFAAPLGSSSPPGVVVTLAACQKDWAPKRLAEAGARRVGGPLYPPLNAFLQAPLALLPPRPAYRVGQLLNLALAFAAGLALARLTRRVAHPLLIEKKSRVPKTPPGPLIPE